MSLSDLGAALIPAGGGIVSNALSFISNERTNKNNLKIARETNQANYDLWKANNEYNTPQAQMARYEAAGLNPNMIYGQVSSGNASSPASAQGAVMKATKFGDFGAANAVMSYLQNKLQNSTIQLQDSQKLKNDAETNKTNVESLNAQKDGLLKDIAYSQKLLDYTYSVSRNPLELRSIEQSIEQKRASLREIDARINNLNASTAKQQAETQLMPEQLEVQKMNAVTARINAMTNKERMQHLNNLTDQELDLMQRKANDLVLGLKLDNIQKTRELAKLALENTYEQFRQVLVSKYGVDIKSSNNISALWNVLRAGSAASNHDDYLEILDFYSNQGSAILSNPIY